MHVLWQEKPQGDWYYDLTAAAQRIYDLAGKEKLNVRDSMARNKVLYVEGMPAGGPTSEWDVAWGTVYVHKHLLNVYKHLSRMQHKMGTLNAEAFDLESKRARSVRPPSPLDPRDPSRPHPLPSPPLRLGLSVRLTCARLQLERAAQGMPETKYTIVLHNVSESPKHKRTRAE